jgi:hypothetical protein
VTHKLTRWKSIGFPFKIKPQSLVYLFSEIHIITRVFFSQFLDIENLAKVSKNSEKLGKFRPEKHIIKKLPNFMLKNWQKL